MIPQPLKSTLFPYTTLFRSVAWTGGIDRHRSRFWISYRARNGCQDTKRGILCHSVFGVTEFLEQCRDQVLHSVTQWPDHSLRDRKSTRLISSHSSKSYAVFC